MCPCGATLTECPDCGDTCCSHCGCSEILARLTSACCDPGQLCAWCEADAYVPDTIDGMSR
jgi:hypothetical protein